ncbi:hypothetical protein P9112_002869 [Eukaryota sp. TZLM1-RC]
MSWETNILSRLRTSKTKSPQKPVLEPSSTETPSSSFSLKSSSFEPSSDPSNITLTASNLFNHRDTLSARDSYSQSSAPEEVSIRVTPSKKKNNNLDYIKPKPKQKQPRSNSIKQPSSTKLVHLDLTQFSTISRVTHEGLSTPTVSTTVKKSGRKLYSDRVCLPSDVPDGHVIHVDLCDVQCLTGERQKSRIVDLSCL